MATDKGRKDVLYGVIQSDGNSLKMDTFPRGYNFWNNDLISILKTTNRPYSCLAKLAFCLNLSKRMVFYL